MKTEQIIHIEIKDGENKGHYYFGSVFATFDKFKKDIGIDRQRLYNSGFGKTYYFENDKCVIRKGIIIRRKSSKN